MVAINIMNCSLLRAKIISNPDSITDSIIILLPFIYFHFNYEIDLSLIEVLSLWILLWNKEAWLGIDLL